MLTSFGENARVTAALQAGALGYLLKDSSPDDLLHAIHSVFRGNLALPQAMARLLMQPPQPSAAALNQLAERELDGLKLVAEGQPNRDIAATLGISVTTVRTLLAKLGLFNRTQLALFASQQGLDSPAR